MKNNLKPPLLTIPILLVFLTVGCSQVRQPPPENVTLIQDRFSSIDLSIYKAQYDSISSSNLITEGILYENKPELISLDTGLYTAIYNLHFEHGTLEVSKMFTVETGKEITVKLNDEQYDDGN